MLASEYDPFRVILTSAMMFLAGGLLYLYVYRARSPRWRAPMFWGGLSAATFILICVVEQVTRFGREDLSWRVPADLFAVVTGVVALYISVNRHKQELHGRR